MLALQNGKRKGPLVRPFRSMDSGTRQNYNTTGENRLSFDAPNGGELYDSGRQTYRIGFRKQNACRAGTMPGDMRGMSPLCAGFEIRPALPKMWLLGFSCKTLGNKALS